MTHQENNEQIRRPVGQYQDEVYYTLDIQDPDLGPKLSETHKQINALEIEKNRIIGAFLKKVQAPRGWSVKLETVYDGRIKVSVSTIIYRKAVEQPKTPPPPPRERTPLEKLSSVIDIKTLFNSGILTKEQKAELLGLNEIFGKKEAI